MHLLQEGPDVLPPDNSTPDISPQKYHIQMGKYEKIFMLLMGGKMSSVKVVVANCPMAKSLVPFKNNCKINYGEN